jgi:hypothetical protein
MIKFVINFSQIFVNLILNQYLVSLFERLLVSLKKDIVHFKSNKIVTFYKMYYKVFLTLLYGCTYFIMYTPTGLTLLYACGTITTLAYQENGVPTLLYTLSHYYWWGSFSVLLAMWLAMQVSFARELLQEVISVKDFDCYLGLNPASKIKAFATSTYTMFLVGGLSFKLGDNTLTRYHNKQTVRDEIELEKLNRQALAPNDPRHQEPFMTSERLHEIMSRSGGGIADTLKGMFNPAVKEQQLDITKIGTLSPAMKELLRKSLEEANKEKKP